MIGSAPAPVHPGPPILIILRRASEYFGRIGKTVGDLWELVRSLLGIFFPGVARRRKLRPWMSIKRGRARQGDRELAVSEADIQRLLARMEALDDSSRMVEKAVGFAGQGADFFANARTVEQMVEALIRENPPFLHIARDRPAQDEGKAKETTTEYLERDSEVVTIEPCTLYIPQSGVEYREHRRPPGYPLLRAAKSLADLRFAPMLYMAMPEDTVIARLVEGSIPILAYREERKLLMFRSEERMIQKREKKHTRVPVEIENGGEGSGTRLMYMLFDRSTSLVRNCEPRGINAMMELAIATAMIRADLGKKDAKYYFRTFAERLWPLANDPPITASTVKEKDDLVQRLFNVNFSGESTNVVEALQSAADDIEKIVASGELGPNVKPRIGLLTDGRATIYLNVGARLKKMGIELDTVLIGREAAHNPELVKISSTVSFVDPELYREAA